MKNRIIGTITREAISAISRSLDSFQAIGQTFRIIPLTGKVSIVCTQSSPEALMQIIRETSGNFRVVL